MSIDDRSADVLEGTGGGQLPLKLYFDPDSGLLLRTVRFTNTLVGQVTTQMDYSDYRARIRNEDAIQVDRHLGGRAVHDGTERCSRERADPPAKFAKPATPEGH